MKGLMCSMVFVISTIALIFALTGNILVNFRKKLGFVIWTISNILWIAVNFLGTLNIPQVIMYLVYIMLNIQGFIVWSRKDKSQR